MGALYLLPQACPYCCFASSIAGRRIPGEGGGGKGVCEVSEEAGKARIFPSSLVLCRPSSVVARRKGGKAHAFSSPREALPRQRESCVRDEEMACAFLTSLTSRAPFPLPPSAAAAGKRPTQRGRNAFSSPRAALPRWWESCPWGEGGKPHTFSSPRAALPQQRQWEKCLWGNGDKKGMCLFLLLHTTCTFLGGGGRSHHRGGRINGSDGPDVARGPYFGDP
ncbi:uncharacterized protein LOC134299614 [Anolis carolinensis]|uniref:uncharacterized protein LOC134299614 n=1 Tax=Anolis carolinensis TaxID=28377 RepID=UPI002F2B6E76